MQDHCHLTGDFRGATHSICNLLLRINQENVRIPFVFHNLKGYDSHLILSHIKICDVDIDVIPNNTKRYTSFSFGGTTLIDSYQFMQASLDSLAKNLEKNNFKNVRRFLESQYIIEEEEEEENQDGVVLGNAEGEIIDEDNIDEEIEGISDYRRSPYISPVLTEEEESSIDEDMALIIRKGVLKFTKTECQLRFPFVIYADFENILKPEPRQNNNKATTMISRHFGSRFCTYIVSSDNRFYRATYTYSGADAAETFVNHIIGEVSELRSILKRVESMKPL